MVGDPITHVIEGPHFLPTAILRIHFIIKNESNAGVPYGSRLWFVSIAVAKETNEYRDHKINETGRLQDVDRASPWGANLEDQV
jgi:hypothetical protein